MVQLNRFDLDTKSLKGGPQIDLIVHGVLNKTGSKPSLELSRRSGRRGSRGRLEEVGETEDPVHVYVEGLFPAVDKDVQ